ncbi:serine protease inhibitor 88Ea-like isoform X4 [Cardiocondyla obscurior]|uniref:serine protease inhibitor 88Ea-like isoform X4 n=1 Tax=Cardiocondyla obscurior TaxID=286306 RepID=UPI0039658029
MLTDARFKFALESLKKYMSTEVKSTFFFSPHILYHNLLVIYFGTDGDSEGTLRKVLNIPDDASKGVIQQFYFNGGVSQFCYILSSRVPNSYTCRIYSRLLINENRVLYIETMNLFSAGHQVKEINFDFFPDYTRTFINSSIKVITQGCIQDVMPRGTIDTKTDAILLNVIYCKGVLESDKIEQLGAYVVELPYKQKKISTYFVIPLNFLDPTETSTQKNSLNELMDRLTTEEGIQALQRVLDNGSMDRTTVLYPILDITLSLNMHKLLNAMGLQEYTASGSGTMNEFTCNGIKLGEAVHRVNIKMTKRTVCATAANVFYTKNSQTHKEIAADTNTFVPSICFIYDKVNRNILFCGVLMRD